MKRDYESRVTPTAIELTDKQAQSFVANISIDGPVAGSVITTINQLGGQVAHQITNIGPQSRKVEAAAADRMIKDLQLLPPEEVEVEVVAGDMEAIRLGHEMAAILQNSGWTIRTFAQSMFPQVIRGLIVSYPRESPGVMALIEWNRALGFQPKVIHSPTLGYVHVLIGTLL
jgi:hypothetical protein